MESCLPDKVKDSTGKGPVAGGNAVDTRAERRPEWPNRSIAVKLERGQWPDHPRFSKVRSFIFTSRATEEQEKGFEQYVCVCVCVCVCTSMCH